MTEERTYRFGDITKFEVDMETRKECNIMIPSPFITITIRCKSLELLSRYK